MIYYTISDSKISLTVLKVDWINFMRHCAWSNLTRFRLLGKIIFWNILPSVFTKPNCYCIKHTNFCHISNQTIVGLDLSCIRIKIQAKLILHKLFTIWDPVNMRIWKVMGIIITYCTINFTSNLDFLNIFPLLSKSICKVCILFT